MAFIIIDLFFFSVVDFFIYDFIINFWYRFFFFFVFGFFFGFRFFFGFGFNRCGLFFLFVLSCLIRWTQNRISTVYDKTELFYDVTFNVAFYAD